MKKQILIVCVVMMNFISAQKVIKKSILNKNTSFVQIDATNCFEVIIENSDANDLVVAAFIDGEYTEDLVLKIKEEGTTLSVSSGFHPNFVDPNDKLSAHKVVAVSLHIKIPRYKEVLLTGTSTNVSIDGFYKTLRFVLNDGRCNTAAVSERTTIKTQSGDITITSPMAHIDASSKYGTVFKEEIPKGHNQFKLTTITGNIYIKKTD